MTIDEIVAVVEEIGYKDWVFYVGFDVQRLYLQVRFVGEDVVTLERSWQHGRKWLLSEHMTKSEIVQTALKAVITAEEHEARERFLYGGRPIYGPHINVDSLWRICDDLEVREEVGI